MEAAAAEGSVFFASVGRSHYAFDVYAVDRSCMRERALTDAISINYNAQFVSPPPAQDEESAPIVYISERLQGMSTVFLDRSPIPGDFRFCDRPSCRGGLLAFASTAGGGSTPRRSASGIFVADILRSGDIPSALPRRLTPEGTADYTPAVSPSGKWIAVASTLGRPWDGEIHELQTAICIFSAEDGSKRRIVAERGGWPSWPDESTLFFHRRAPEDDWWSIYRVQLEEDDQAEDQGNARSSRRIDRVTPPGVHAFTPAASSDGSWIAVATRRIESKFRHIEIFNLETREFSPLTSELHPELHHFSPFLLEGCERIVGYHRSRKPEHPQARVPLLQHVASPLSSRLTMFRLDGAFPSVSPDGTLIAYNSEFEADDSGVFVAKLDGSSRRRIYRGLAFSTAWDWKQPGVIYTSVGHIFSSESSTVHIVKLIFDVQSFESGCSSEELEASTRVVVLTKEGTLNNAFPSPSPDGKQLVFRSARGGHKNLYILEDVSAAGEQGGVRALTCGDWIDTMPSWSPDGQWIAFSSSRDDNLHQAQQQSMSFTLYLVRPDGSELHRVVPHGDGQQQQQQEQLVMKGRFNHVCFSPDSSALLFTADVGGISAEPVSVANQFQPYGELFMCKLDGSGLVRLTENAYEDGTPCWGSLRLDPSEASDEGTELSAKFQDCLWLDTVSDKMKLALS